MRFLRTNTAVRVTVGPFFDKADGVTPETSLTVTNCKLTLMVDSANVPTLVLDASATASGGNNDMVHVTNDDAGFYDLELTAANTNFLGRAILAITDAANHCPVFHEFMILPAMIYDSLILGTDRFDVNLTHTNDVATSAVPRIWYVAASGGSDSNSGLTRSAALATREQALSNASNGDTIWFIAGSYSWTTVFDTSSKKNLTLRGDGVATVITLTTATPYTGHFSIGDDTEVCRMKLVCANKGSGVVALGSTYAPHVHHCYIDGAEDACLFDGSANAYIHDNYMVANWDVLTLQFNCRAFRAENNYIQNDCSDTSANTNYSALNVEDSSGVATGNYIVAEKGINNAQNAQGVKTGTNSSNAQGVSLINNVIHVTSAQGTGRAICIADTSADIAPARISVSGGSVYADHATDATREHHIRVLGTGSDVKASLVANLDASLCTSNVEVVGENVSAFNVDKDHTWDFNSPNQLTAPKILSENIGFIGLLAMDFTEPMPALTSIASVSSATFANISGTEPTVSSTAVSADKKKAHITINAASATANTYTLTVTIVTTDSQTFVRSGRLTVA